MATFVYLYAHTSYELKEMFHEIKYMVMVTAFLGKNEIFKLKNLWLRHHMVMKLYFLNYFYG